MKKMLVVLWLLILISSTSHIFSKVIAANVAEDLNKTFITLEEAEELGTYKNSKNFDKEIFEFINKSPPTLSQQLAMPNGEIERLLSKYESENNSLFFPPKIIIINKKNSILKKSYVNNNKYCKAFEGKIYDFYYSFDLNTDCDK